MGSSLDFPPSIAQFLPRCRQHILLPASDQVTSAMMQYNRKWILEQIRSGRPIIEIGKDPNRTIPSIFYEMKRNMLKSYQKLHPEFTGAVKQ